MSCLAWSTLAYLGIYFCPLSSCPHIAGYDCSGAWAAFSCAHQRCRQGLPHFRSHIFGHTWSNIITMTLSSVRHQGSIEQGEDLKVLMVHGFSPIAYFYLFPEIYPEESWLNTPTSTVSEGLHSTKGGLSAQPSSLSLSQHIDRYICVVRPGVFWPTFAFLIVRFWPKLMARFRPKGHLCLFYSGLRSFWSFS